MRAIIFAGGYGKRINNKIKALLTVDNISIIQRQINFLKKNNIHNIFIVDGYGSEVIRKELKDVTFYKIADVDNGKALNIFLNKFKYEDSLILDGDLIYDEEVLSSFLQELIKNKKSYWVGDFNKPKQIDDMGILLENKRVIGFDKKEGKGSGIFVYLEKKDLIILHKELKNNNFRWWIQGLKDISIYENKPGNLWIDIDSMEDYNKAKIMFETKYTFNDIDLLPEEINTLYETMDFKGFHREKRSITKDLIMLNNSLFLTARYNKKLIGFMRAITDNCYYCGIWDVMIDPTFQNYGLGSRLMRLFMNKLSSISYLKIFLFSAFGKENWYNKFGFNLAKAPVMEIRND